MDVKKLCHDQLFLTDSKDNRQPTYVRQPPHPFKEENVSESQKDGAAIISLEQYLAHYK